MRKHPRPQEIYRHFKGDLYRIVTMAEHEETGEELVIYQALYGEYKVYARELSSFMARTDSVKYPQALQEFRFELQNELIGQGPIGIREKERQEDHQKDTLGEEADPGKKALGEDAALGKKASGEEADPGKKALEEEADQEEPVIDPQVLKFLDADSYQERLHILSFLHGRITHEMINTMAIVLDIEIGEGELDERYQQLKNCLMTLEKYECNRLR